MKKNSKNQAKKFHAAKPLAFSLHFLFRRDQNHYSNLIAKIMKMCEQILKKRQRPNTIQILWIVKKTKRRPIIASNRITPTKTKKSLLQNDSRKIKWYSYFWLIAIFFSWFKKILEIEINNLWIQ